MVDRGKIQLAEHLKARLSDFREEEINHTGNE
jgi:hypothetical protein